LMTTFAQTSSPVDIIRAILRQYPFGVGLFRELLQNSDDAGASEQVFVLDRRSHQHKGTAFANGPALLAFNDATVTDVDWVGLQTINSSPKRTDARKTGKYGLGFRSCFHVSDTPEILSGHYLATFDPLKVILDVEGKKVDLHSADAAFQDHLAAFSSVCDSIDPLIPFRGTAIRLPLREPSRYREGLAAHINEEKIRSVLLEFVRSELSIVMLFLRSVTSIVIKEVDTSGAITTLASASLEKSEDGFELPFDARFHKSRVTVSATGTETSATWCIVSRSPHVEEFATELSRLLGEEDISKVLEREKLYPHIALAVPLAQCEETRQHLGRLFATLPLPIHTPFPCLINGTFALTSDRQHLCNPHEQNAGQIDRLLQKWNGLLFSRALPSAWAAMLVALVKHGQHVFDFWPSLVANDCGDSHYWKDVAIHLAHVISVSQLSVWPLLGDGLCNHTSLTQDVLIVSPCEASAAVTRALCSPHLSVKMCQIPTRIKDVLDQAGFRTTVLSPQSVQKQLIVCVSFITVEVYSWLLQERPLDLIRLSQDNGSLHMQSLLEYLLKPDHLACALGLPIIPTTKSGYIQLSTGGTCYAILSKNEIDLFDPSERSFVRIEDLPVSFLASPFPTGYNIFSPSPRDIANLVELCVPGSSGTAAVSSVGPGNPIFTWLQRLWAWIVGLPYDRRQPIIRELSAMRILPTTSGVLASPSSTLYCHTSDVSDPHLRLLLEGAGLRFLHSEFLVEGLYALGFLRTVDDVSGVLCFLASRSRYILRAPESQLAALSKMLAAVIGRQPRLSNEAQANLRVLPVFLVLPSGSTAQKSSRTSMSIRSIVRLPPTDTPLPIVPETIFIDERDSDSCALARACNSDVRYLGEIDVLCLALVYFLFQPFSLQVLFTEHMGRRGHALPRDLAVRLSRIAFVPVGDGCKVACPEDVVCPNSAMTRDLFGAHDLRMPRMSTEEQRILVNSLSSLGLLITSLTPAIAAECIDRIAPPAFSTQLRASQTFIERLELSRKLLHSMNSASADFSAIVGSLNKAWIPCLDGKLCRPSDCRHDIIGAGRSRALFDAVLNVSEICVTSPSLRRLLGWDSPIPYHILEAQLASCLSRRDEHESIEYLKALLQEFGRRYKELSRSEIDRLRAIVQGKPWIPVGDRLVETSFAVFQDSTVAPFCVVGASNNGTRHFLRAMGCSNRPSPEAILQALASQQADGMAVDFVAVVSLLQGLHQGSLTASFLSELLVPADDGSLHPQRNTFFNDLGSNSYLVSLPDGTRRAHGSVSRDLAQKLRLKDLSTLWTEDDDEEYGEQFATRIRNALRQYRREQLPAEFLANAIDAGAATMEIIVDGCDFSNACERLIAPGLAECHSNGALVFYNDSVFSKDDWKGIKRVGEGSKRSKVGKIGRFGVGSLSAYHVCEAMMIVSGDTFLLLDPSRRFLGIRASCQVKLKEMRILWPDNLLPFIGLHGFKEDTEFYQGTLFRLPLRTLAQAQKSELSNTYVGISDAKLLAESYVQRAEQSGFFVPGVTAVSACMRSGPSPQSIVSLWSLGFQRDTILSTDPVTPAVLHEQITLRSSLQTTTQVWRTSRHLLCKTDIPVQFHDLFQQYLIPSELSVGVALQVSRSVSLLDSSLFSFLPLPVSTSLPFHLHASFVLSEDRRNIRFDDSGKEPTESSFNKFLLSDILPSVYFSLLHNWPSNTTPLSDTRLWPGMSKDKLSQFVANTFLSLLPNEPRSVCENIAGMRISPRTATFAGFTLPAAVKEVLKVIAPTDLIFGPKVLSRAVLPPVTPAYVHKVILDRREHFIASYFDGSITLVMLSGIVSYLVPEIDLERVSPVGLPCIPLADGGIDTFRISQGLENKKLVWLNAAQMDLFGRHLFVHPDVAVAFDCLPRIFPSLNVAPMNDASLAHLVRKRISPSHERTLSEAEASFVGRFWETFCELHSPGKDLHKDLRDIPIIPLATSSTAAGPRTFISFSRCSHPSTILRPLSAPQSIIDAFVIMGARLVDKENAPPPLQEKLSFMNHSFVKLASFLVEDPTVPVAWRFVQLGASAPQFRKWLRRQCISDTHLSSNNTLILARKLPLFRVRNTQGFVSAEEAIVLPSAANMGDCVPFLPWRNFVAYDDLLLKLGAKPISHSQLVNHFSEATMNTVIPPGNIAAFRRILVHLLAAAQGLLVNQPQQRVLVPNATGVFVSPQTLYSRETDLFRSAFEGRRPEAFIHPELAEVGDPQLHVFGMHVHVDTYAFLDCARTISAATDVNRIASARLAYNHYNNVLSRVPHVGWGDFDNLSFVPRAAERRRGMPDFDGYAVPLPEVVSPAKMIRAEFEGVAWTQRACFETGPSPHLLFEHSRLGVPSFHEVAEHLRVLRMIATDLRYQHNAVLVADLQATYKYLQDRISEISPGLSRSLGDVFLNVNDPTREWDWCQASQLVVNAASEDENYKRTRSFLKPYSTLIVALGGSKVDAVAKPIVARSLPEESLRRLRLEYNSMRKMAQGTDACLIDQEGRGHPAHRTFLAAWSPIFKASFIHSGMSEANDGASARDPVRHSMQEYCSEAVECVLGATQYLNDSSSAHRDILEDVVKIADFYALDELKCTAEASLVAHISPASYERIRTFAEFYRAATLLEKCDEWMRRNEKVMRKVKLVREEQDEEPVV
ncbi:hypothetical protein K488DRAFT_55472, partial [Vararia minispora EC-137]